MSKLTDGFFRGAVDRIKTLQRSDGAIPWYAGGVVDPWNHLEAVMGLNLCGEAEAVSKGFEFLINTQLPDGSWWGRLGSAVPIDDTLQNFSSDGMDTGEQIRETNFTAYVATAVWHDYLLHNNMNFIHRLWPVVTRALDFVCRHQTPHGDIVWISHAPTGDSDPIDPEILEQTDSLLTGNSSLFKSLSCGLKLAELMNESKSDWVNAHRLLGQALRDKPHRFQRQTGSDMKFSMDWYYPCLSGALSKKDSLDRLQARWDEFVVEGHGCRCVSHEPWVTVAETAELILTLKSLSMDDRAAEMLGWLDRQRDENGAYWIGFEYESKVFWPVEKPPWTAGAVILATDCVNDLSPASHLFLHQGL
ncbi:MAG: prenyltransferase [Parvibaculales bacterium]